MKPTSPLCSEPQRAAWLFAPDLGSVTQARGLIADCLTGFSRESLENVLLLTSELTTNAVRHGTGPVLVQLSWQGEEIQVGVSDQSPASPVLRDMDREAVNGRGLLLVDGLSTAWGVRSWGEGKTVWFTLGD